KNAQHPNAGNSHWSPLRLQAPQADSPRGLVSVPSRPLEPTRICSLDLTGAVNRRHRRGGRGVEQLRSPGLALFTAAPGERASLDDLELPQRVLVDLDSQAGTIIVELDEALPCSRLALAQVPEQLVADL